MGCPRAGRKAWSVPARAGDQAGDLRQVRVGAAFILESARQHRHAMAFAFPVAHQHRAGLDAARQNGAGGRIFFKRATRRSSSRCVADGKFAVGILLQLVGQAAAQKSGPKAGGGSQRNSPRQRARKTAIGDCANCASSRAIRSGAGISAGMDWRLQNENGRPCMLCARQKASSRKLRISAAAASSCCVASS